MAYISLPLASTPSCRPHLPPLRRLAVLLTATLLLTATPLAPAQAAGTASRPAPSALPPAVTPTGPEADEIIYLVQPGDTLLGLARSTLDHPGRWRDVQRLNGIERPRHLQPGSQLRIRRAWLKPEAVAATVSAASNQVAIDGKPVQDNQALKEGSTIRTGPDSTAVISLPDGTTLRIPSATEVRLERLRAYHGDKDLDAAFLLRRGGIEPDSPGKRSRPLRIRTPAGNAAVRGTHFRVQAEARHSTVEVLRGQVAAGNRSGTADVDAGKGARVSPGKRPQVVPLPPAPDLGSFDGRVLEQVSSQLALPPLARGMSAYQVAVSTRADFNDILLDARVKQPGFALNSRRDGPHYVRVRQISHQGIAGYDAVARVEVEARPLPPRLQAQPATVMAGAPVRFVWQDAEEVTGTGERPAHHYRVQVAADAGFGQVLHDVIVPAPQAELLLDTAGSPDRWWRVAAIDGQDQGPFSAAQHFTLQVPAPISTSQPRPAVKSADGEPVRTGSGDFLLLGH